MGYGGKGKGYGGWVPIWNPAFMKWGKGKGKGKRVDPSLKVWIGDLPPTVDWKALQAHMNQAGKTKWVEVFSGKGAGTGCASYGSPTEVTNAVAMLNGTDLGGQTITVDVWVAKPKEA